MLRVDSSNIANQPNVRVNLIGNRVVGNDSSLSKGFEGTLKSKSLQDLDSMLQDIKNKGEKLSKTQNYMDALSYKKAIKSYLSDVIDHMYVLNKSDSFWSTKSYSVVDKIDSELHTITSSLLNSEANSIEVLKSIDKIEGMLVELMA